MIQLLLIGGLADECHAVFVKASSSFVAFHVQQSYCVPNAITAAPFSSDAMLNVPRGWNWARNVGTATTTSWLATCCWPSRSVPVIVTVYVPGAAYVLTGWWKMLDVPSPKVHAQDWSPNSATVVSTKSICCWASGAAGEYEKVACLTTCSSVNVLDPFAFVAVSVTEYGPAAAYV